MGSGIRRIRRYEKGLEGLKHGDWSWMILELDIRIDDFDRKAIILKREYDGFFFYCGIIEGWLMIFSLGC